MSDYAETARAHADCAVCGAADRDPAPLGLRFGVAADGSVAARFAPGRAQQGYAGLVHGGVISTLIDAAMVHCLFARGVRAVTAELNVRFVAPARLDAALEITGRLVEDRRRAFRLVAAVAQFGGVVARGTGLFVLPRPAFGADTQKREG